MSFGGLQSCPEAGHGDEHRGALRGTPGSACPQPEPNATELPSCAPISARTAQRQGGGGGGVARRARAARAPKPKSCATSCDTSSAAPCAASFTCSSFTCHLRAGVGWGSRPGRRAPQHTFLFLPPERLPSPPLLRARPSRVDRHCHWACRTNKGPRTPPQSTPMHKPQSTSTRQLAELSNYRQGAAASSPAVLSGAWLELHILRGVCCALNILNATRQEERDWNCNTQPLPATRNSLPLCGPPTCFFPSFPTSISFLSP